MGRIGSRKAGWQNDLRNFAAIDHSYSAHNALPESRLTVMNRGTHLAFYAHPDAVGIQEEACMFLAANS